MRAMLLTGAHKPLELKNIPIPKPGPKQVLIKISCCGICRTDLHVIDGELPSPKLPLVPGHQIVGKIEQVGSEVNTCKPGMRVGVPWLGGSCGVCDYCKSGHENLCDHAVYTGYQIDGGFAEYCLADAKYTFPIPTSYSDTQAAPLLCAGLIGFRALRMTAGAKRIGFYGFGASAHLLVQIVNHREGEVYAFTKPGDIKGQEFAKSCGASWAGSTNEEPPFPLDAVIIFAPVGSLVPKALHSVKKGGIVVCAGIHMSDIPTFSYHLLWGERILRSVANLTRKDGEDFLALAPQIPIETHISTYSLEDANQALDDLRRGHLLGAAVLTCQAP
ncbi:MAG: putative alcohol dehydrogenase AdhA [Chlamydiales bacterium]|nr:putative alcohol dehydrogenase AdhA [Chlamydiales bacterium]